MLNAWLPFGEPLAKMMDFAISFGVVTLVFAMIFKILPDVKLAWSDVWTGAAATSALFTIGKFLIGLYLGKSSVGSDYGNRRFGNYHDCVGVLLGSDSIPWRGVYTGLCESIRLSRCSGGQCRADPCGKTCSTRFDAENSPGSSG